MLRLVHLIAILTLLSSAALGQVTIRSHPPSVKTRQFEPKAPPREMPSLEPGEAAVCESKFACGVQVEVEITQPADGKPTAKVTGVVADLNLSVILWLPTNATRKIRDHEEGHRKISELFFERGEQTATELAKKQIGRSIDIDGIDPTQTRPVIERLATEFCQQYLAAIEAPSQKVQVEYDRITDHGRNDLTEKRAIEQALKTSLPPRRP